MANSEDPDLDLHCLLRKGISGFRRTRVKSVLSVSQTPRLLKLYKHIRNDAFCPLSLTDTDFDQLFLLC